MSDLLPIGAYVRVNDRHRGDIYTGRITGYDVFRSKYKVSRRYRWGGWSTGDYWAFLGEVEEIGEVEALAVPAADGDE